MVVELVAVNVVYLWQVVGVGDERLGYQSMNLHALCLVIHPERHGIVAASLYGLRHDAVAMSFQASHPSMIAHHILTIEPLNRSPLFLFHTTSYY